MIKILQKKFVFTAMIVVSILLLILLGTINVVNIVMVRNETDKTLAMISAADGNFDHIQPPPNSTPPSDFRIEPKDERDKFLSSNFFIIIVKIFNSITYIIHVGSRNSPLARCIVFTHQNRLQILLPVCALSKYQD